MRQFIICSVVVAVIFCGACTGEEDESCIKVDVHGYLDRVLEKARQELDDPMRLPARSTIVELSDGLLWGMSNITRLGEAEVTCEGNTVTIKGKITTDEIKGRYTWSKEKKGKKREEGYIVFISHNFEADMEVMIEKKTGEKSHPELKRFVIKKFKDAKIEITGKGYVGWALGEITTLVSGVFERSIASAIQNPMEEALERQLRDIEIE